MSNNYYDVPVSLPSSLDVDNQSFQSEKEKPDPVRPNLLEKVLSIRIKAGDHAAFDCLFTAYYRDLVLFAAHFTRESGSAEEIVQENFVRLWEDREKINEERSLKAYLLKMIKNCCIDWYRHQKIVHKYESFFIENTALFQCDTDNYILHAELLKQLNTALSQMPWEIAEVYRMNRFGCNTYSEIAEKRNVSVRTVEVWIGRALHLLRKHLKDYLQVVIGTLSIYGYTLI